MKRQSNWKTVIARTAAILCLALVAGCYAHGAVGVRHGGGHGDHHGDRD